MSAHRHGKSASIYKTRSGTGLFGFLVGLPFFCGGCFFVWGGLTAKLINSQPPTALMRLAFCTFAMLFVIVGGVLMFTIHGVWVDQQEGTLTRWWGILFPLGCTSEPLGTIDRVKVTKETRTHHSNGNVRTSIVYPVYLLHQTGKAAIGEDRDYLASRQQGEALARHLNVALDDDTTGSRVSRDPDELDLSLRDMLLKYDAHPERPQLPEGTRLKFRMGTEPGGEIAEVALPHLATERPKVVRWMFSTLLVIIVLLLALHWRMLHTPTWDGLIVRAAPTVLLLGIARIIGKALRNGLIAYAIRISRSEVCFSRTLLGLTRRKTIPVARIEELHIIPCTGKRNSRNGKLVALSDGFRFSWGDHNPLPDLKFVEQMVRHVIGSP